MGKAPFGMHPELISGTHAIKGENRLFCPPTSIFGHTFNLKDRAVERKTSDIDL